MPAPLFLDMPSRPPVHVPIGARSDAERRADRVASVPSPSRVYGRRWQALRLAYLAQHPLCECGCEMPATVVDHRYPHRGDPALFWAWSNLQAMSKPCHDAKTAREDGGFGNPARPRVRYLARNSWPVNAVLRG